MDVTSVLLSLKTVPLYDGLPAFLSTGYAAERGVRALPPSGV